MAMNKLLHIRLGWRAFIGELTPGKRHQGMGWLTLILVAVVAFSGCLLLVADHTQRLMTRQSAELLGGHLRVKSSYALDALPTEGLDKVASASYIGFSTMAYANDEFLLTSVKAVDDSYPLLGKLLIERDELESVTHGPKPGELWLDLNAMQRMGLTLGDSVEMGDVELKVSAVIQKEPDQVGGFAGFAPRVIANKQDVAAMNVLGAGSRVSFVYLFSGDKGQLDILRQRLDQTMTVHQEVTDVEAQQPRFGRLLLLVSRFITVINVTVLLLCSIAMVMVSYRYVQQQTHRVAVMRCYGLTQREYGVQLITQLLLLSCFVSLVGGGIGYGLYSLLDWVWRNWLHGVSISPSLWVMLKVIAMVWCLVFGVIFSQLRQLFSIPANYIVRRQVLRPSRGAYIWLAGSLLVLVLIIGGLSITSFAIFGAIIGFSLLFTLLGWLVYRKLGAALSQFGGLAWRQTWLYCRARWGVLTLQSGALVLASAITLGIGLVGGNLLDFWKTQIPENTPNYFAVNVFPEDVASFSDRVIEEGHSFSSLYPIVRGRLIKVNGESVRQRVSKESQARGAIERELNLTWADKVPDDNVMTDGLWWDQLDPSLSLTPVSVEQRLAERMGLKLQDVLTFSIAGSELEAKITSIRTVDWDSFHPNFYMIFPPQTIERFNTTYIGSFFLPADKRHVIKELVQAYPSVMMIDIEAVLTKVQAIVGQAMLIARALLVFVVIASLVVVMAAFYLSAQERRQYGQLLGQLGATSRQLSRRFLTEFAIFGGMIALVSFGIAQAIYYQVAVRGLELSPPPFDGRTLLYALIIGIITLILGVISQRITAKN